MTIESRLRADYIRARSKAEKSDRRRKILDTATNLVLEGSLEDLSIATLARRSGIAKGTIYLYFETKFDVIDHLLLDSLVSWSNMMVEQIHGEITDTEFTDLFWSCTRSNQLTMMLTNVISARGLYSQPAAKIHEFQLVREDILIDLMHLMEDCLNLPKGGGGFALMALFAFICGVTQQDFSVMAPDAELPEDFWRHSVPSEDLFRRSAPGIIAASRSYERRPNASAEQPEQEIV